MPPLPRLIGVLHLPPLAGSPRYAGDAREAARAAAEGARALAEAGFEAVLVENFGDAPFFPGRVPPVTVAAMTTAALAAREAAPSLALGVNVLRNDAEAALAVAVASGARFVRVNVHVGARVTDQGIVEGRAHDTLRQRRALGAEDVALFCDVDVKHAAPITARPLAEEAAELAGRGLADALLVTGSGTGASVKPKDLEASVTAGRAAGAPVYVASGALPEDLEGLARAGASGVIVGSALRKDGRPGGPVDPARARDFAEAFRRAF